VQRLHLKELAIQKLEEDITHDVANADEVQEAVYINFDNHKEKESSHKEKESYTHAETESATGSQFSNAIEEAEMFLKQKKGTRTDLQNNGDQSPASNSSVSHDGGSLSHVRMLLNEPGNRMDKLKDTPSTISNTESPTPRLDSSVQVEATSATIDTPPAKRPNKKKRVSSPPNSAARHSPRLAKKGNKEAI
jgi:hypothetical protein